MGGEVVWFTLSAREPDALTSFYEDLLGWNVDQARLTSDSGVSGTLRVIETGGLPGSISNENERGVVLMVQVDDLDATLDHAHVLGTAPIREDYEVEGIGLGDGRYRVAWLTDPEGNRLALVAADPG